MWDRSHQGPAGAAVRRAAALSPTVREPIEPLGFQAAKTIIRDYLPDFRSPFQKRRACQRLIYRPAEACQFDLWGCVHGSACELRP